MLAESAGQPSLDACAGCQRAPPSPAAPRARQVRQCVVSAGRAAVCAAAQQLGRVRAAAVRALESPAVQSYCKARPACICSSAPVPQTGSYVLQGL
jgi:hypothetical protein